MSLHMVSGERDTHGTHFFFMEVQKLKKFALKRGKRTMTFPMKVTNASSALLETLELSCPRNKEAVRPEIVRIATKEVQLGQKRPSPVSSEPPQICTTVRVGNGMGHQSSHAFLNLH